MFARALETLFTGFNVAADTNIIKALSQKGEKDVFIIKKSKFYITLFSFGTIIQILLIAIINIALLFFTNILPDLYKRILAGGLGINLLVRFFTTIFYLNLYSKTYGVFKIMPATERIPVLQKGDNAFRKFFDNTIWLIILYIIIVVFFIFSSFFLVNKISTIDAIVIFGNIFLFMRQFHQLIRLLMRFIDLEMDFVIVTKDHIKHYDQQKLGIKTKTLDVRKIKTIKSNKIGGLRSILNFGEVLILTEGDTGSEADLWLKYIVRPETVEGLLNDLIENKKIEKKKERADLIGSIVGGNSPTSSPTKQ